MKENELLKQSVFEGNPNVPNTQFGKLFKDLKTAFKQDYSTDFTDDARVVESIGVKINLVEGSYRNIKITTPEDLDLAEVLLK